MSRIQRYQFLQIFGDGKGHNWFEIVFLGVQFLKVRQSKFEKIMQLSLEYNLIQREYKAAHPKDDFYVITSKGDECLRSEQIARAGDQSYYKYYDRSIDGANGANKYAPIPKGYVKEDAG